MKKLTAISLFIFTLIALSGCGQVVGSGNLVTETRQVSGFNRVELAGSGEVEIVLGEEESITIEAEDNLIDLIETRVTGNTLYIGFKPNTSVTSLRSMRFTVYMKSLEGASINGSGRIEIPESNYESLDLRVSGSGRILASGSVESLSAELPGSGSIDCKDLEAGLVDATISGSGDITVTVLKSLDARISGSGNVRYYGDPASVNQVVSGSGNIRKMK